VFSFFLDEGQLCSTQLSQQARRETKKSRTNANSNLFSLKKACAMPPKKLSARVPAPSLKKYTVLFLYARPCAVRSRQPHYY
jgi:hypothetical protein